LTGCRCHGSSFGYSFAITVGDRVVVTASFKTPCPAERELYESNSALDGALLPADF
jgi:hypothetical protein